ncbi:GntR family transcriptional regulator [Microbacterium lacus]|uniref:GntR family transcriptional regulator n=1 Tax=Microbacterium lacus TaxID=415217 RepID=UPI000C2BD4E2|nr:GntR family transcriptional regulator [Microbacterium lacus]
MDSFLTIETAAATPPFEQLRIQLIGAIETGRLVPGERLPTVRRLAEDLGIAAGTVARAYRELEASGFVETRGRNGTFVAPHGDAAHREAQRAAMVFADQIRALRFDTEEAMSLVAAALQTETRTDALT